MSEENKERASITFTELSSGYEFPAASYLLDAALVSRYLEAVEGDGDGFVPPLAIAAYAMKAMMDVISLPSGAIHASQELEFFKLVPVGSEVKCQSRVARKISRSRMKMMVLEMDVRDENGDRVQSGKATVILPP
ncbi:MAG: MaoC family dehydratase [Dehalococcoidia bacterium]|nr:MaoC family dehydratase [Dehalococcoidia bacterium]